MALNASDDIIGVGRIHVDSVNSAQIRFMAVAPAYQRHGVGSKILHDLYKFAQVSNVQKIWLKARTDASNFYLKLGYEIRQEVESDLMIPHVLMEKYL